MINNMQILYKSLNSISEEYLMGINRNNIKRVKSLVPQIIQLATWILEENKFGIEQKDYQELSSGFLQILEDIMVALEQEDHVLLHDAVGYGLLEYLKLFVEQEDVSNVNL